MSQNNTVRNVGECGFVFSGFPNGGLLPLVSIFVNTAHVCPSSQQVSVAERGCRPATRSGGRARQAGFVWPCHFLRWHLGMQSRPDHALVAQIPRSCPILALTFAGSRQFLDVP